MKPASVKETLDDDHSTLPDGRNSVDLYFDTTHALNLASYDVTDGALLNFVFELYEMQHG